MIWTGGCLCGKRRYEARNDPVNAGYCHCKMCQRATGGPSAMLVRFNESDLRWTGEPPAIYRSSPIAVRGFCPDCGSPLFLSYDDDEFLRMTTGTLDNASAVAPQGHYGVESRMAWDDCGHGLPEEETKQRF